MKNILKNLKSTLIIQFKIQIKFKKKIQAKKKKTWLKIYL